MKNKGITLIALVITIVVLLILAGISLSISIGNNGIISKAVDAKNKTQLGEENDTFDMNDADMEMDRSIGKIVFIVNGKKQYITKENFAQYLGKKVINYKTGSNTTETINVDDTDYTVSTTYRLFYIDFDNKFGDGVGTIYLKADYTDNNYLLKTSTDITNSKIKNLNPSLFKDKTTTPDISNWNTQATIWLTNSQKWLNLTNEVNNDVANYINYVVGSPSLEMLIDSYNIHYGLTGDVPNYSKLDAGSERVKLFYKYTLGNTGYEVGPNSDRPSEYGYYTSDYSMKSDSLIDSMYHPGSDSKYYWISSPSADSQDYMMIVSGSYGGYVNANYSSSSNGICPLVSIRSNAELSLEN